MEWSKKQQQDGAMTARKRVTRNTLKTKERRREDENLSEYSDHGR